jgi:ATP synthase protein I
VEIVLRLNHKDSRSTFRALGLTGGIGCIMAACILGGYFVGSYLDSKFGTAPWLLLVFILMSIAAGFLEVYKILKKAMKEATGNDKKNKKN